MSHYYIRKSYTFNELDQKLDDLKSEMKEYVRDQVKTRDVIIDAPPYPYHNVEKLMYEINFLRDQVYFLNYEFQKLKIKEDYDEPTL